MDPVSLQTGPDRSCLNMHDQTGQTGRATAQQAQPGPPRPSQVDARAKQALLQERRRAAERARARSRGRTLPAQALIWLEEFKSTLLTLEEWRVHFELARILRNVTDTDPHQFHDLLAEWLPSVRRSPPFDELFYRLIEDWQKVNCPAGGDGFDVAMKHARQYPAFFRPDEGPRYQLLANFAYYTDAIVGVGGVILLPRERLGKELDVTPRTVTSIVRLLEKHEIVRCTNENYSQAAGRAKEYVFVANDAQIRLPKHQRETET